MFKASNYIYYADDEEEDMEIDLQRNLQVDSLDQKLQQPQQNLQIDSLDQKLQQPQQTLLQSQQQQILQPQQPGLFGYVKSFFGNQPQQPQPQQQQQQQQQQPPINNNNNNINNTYYNNSNPFGQPTTTTTKTTKVKKSNTNVLVTELGIIAKVSTIATGDPIFCKECKSIFSNINSFDEIKEKDGKVTKNIPTGGGFSDGKWTCEFCSAINKVGLSDAELPKSNIVDFILEQAPITTTSCDDNNNNTKEQSKDESMVLFCIDTSGSMDTTSKVSSEFQRPKSLIGKANSQYVSRLECVQIAIDKQLNDMAVEHPNRKVGIVTFSESVKILDKSGTPIVVPEKDFNNVSSLLEIGANYKIEEPLEKSKQSIIDLVYTLKASGSTALGPSITTAIGIAGKHPASKIVLCTDGCANKGVGSVEGAFGGSNNNPKEFYEQMASIAQKNGISISVLSMKGADCRMEHIGKLADITNGDVRIIDPLKLDSDFKDIFALPVIATNVSIKLILHNGLYVSADGESTNSSRYEKSIGNVNDETSFTFEYGVKKGSKDHSKDLKSLPFQLQIYYTTLSGAKCVRVITNTQEITKSKEVAEEHADIEILGQNIVQASSNVAFNGDYAKSKAKNYQGAEVLQRIMKKQQTSIPPTDINQQAKYENAKVWLSQAQNLEDQLTTQMSSNVNAQMDTTSNVIYNMKSMNSSKAKKFSK